MFNMIYVYHTSILNSSSNNILALTNMNIFGMKILTIKVKQIRNIILN